MSKNIRESRFLSDRCSLYAPKGFVSGEDKVARDGGCSSSPQFKDVPCKIFIKESSVVSGHLFSTNIAYAEWIFDGYQVFGEGWFIELTSFKHPDAGSMWKVESPPRVCFGRSGRISRKRIRAIRLPVVG